MLNKNQQKAAYMLSGNVLIQAGAGTGKTTTLISRIRNLITKKKLNPAKILAITFTNKAADHLKEVLNDIPQAKLVTACTIHSYCARLLRKPYVSIQLPEYHLGWKIYDSSQANNVVTRCFNQYAQDQIDKIMVKHNLSQLNNYADMYNNEHKRGKIIITNENLANDVTAKKIQRKLAKTYFNQLISLLKDQRLKHVSNLRDTFYQALRIYRVALVESYFYHYQNHDSYAEQALENFLNDLRHHYGATLYSLGIDKDFFTIIKYSVFEYIEALKHDNAMDFDDLIYNSVIALSKSPTALLKAKNAWQSISVDEYQDVSDSQEMLIYLLSNDNLCVVGDPNQSIYSFRGANVNNIINFKSEFNNAQLVTLSDNYRSTQPILNAATSLIKHNQRQTLGAIELKAHASNSMQKPIVTEYYNADNEMQGVTNKILELHAKGINYNKIGVLYSFNNMGTRLAKELMQSHIPYHLAVSTPFNELTEISTTLSYANLICDNTDNDSFKVAIMTPDRNVGTKTLAAIEQASFWTNHNSMLEVLKNIDQVKLESGKHINKTTQKKLSAMYKEIDNLKKQKFTSLAELIENCCNNFVCEISSEDKTKFNQENNFALDDTKGNCLLLIKMAEEVDQKYDQNNLKQRLSILESNLALLNAESENEGENDNNESQVELMTIHKSKGLEFDYVFIINLNEGVCPYYNRNNVLNNSALEEERRKLYVAMTRAKKQLYMSYVDYNIFYSKAYPSRFLSEIDNDLYQYENKSQEK